MNRLILAAMAALMLCRGAAADPPTEIDYQGKISIGRSPYSGVGHFKFAITDSSEGTNYWSNDGTSAGEPSASFALTVKDGRFSTLLGAAPMQSIEPERLAAAEASFLRVWFSQDGAAFRELKPKQKMVSSPFAIHALRLGGKSREYFEDAARLSAGTISDDRLSANVTRLGATIGPGELDQGAIGTREIADGSIKADDLDLSDTDARYVRHVDGVVAGPLCVAGSVGIGTNQSGAALHVAGPARFDGGIRLPAPSGDLLMGVYTNSP